MHIKAATVSTGSAQDGRVPIEEGEALDVQHVHLVNEEHATDHICFALLTPLSHTLINLLTDLRLDLALTTTESQAIR